MSRVVVVDTSVFVSSLISPLGHSRSAIRACLRGEYQPIMGTKLYLEYESVMQRNTLFARSPISAEERHDLFLAFLSVCRWVKVYYIWRPNLQDEADNHVLELAVAGGAEIIMTHNIKDFQSGNLLFPAITILRPKDLERG